MFLTIQRVIVLAFFMLGIGIMASSYWLISVGALGMTLGGTWLIVTDTYERLAKGYNTSETPLMTIILYVCAGFMIPGLSIFAAPIFLVLMLRTFYKPRLNNNAEYMG